MTERSTTGDHAHDLTRLAHQQADLDRRIRIRVGQARAAGISWAVIGKALGLSKQGAQQRYRDAPIPTEPDNQTQPAFYYDKTKRGWTAPGWDD